MRAPEAAVRCTGCRQRQAVQFTFQDWTIPEQEDFVRCQVCPPRVGLDNFPNETVDKVFLSFDVPCKGVLVPELLQPCRGKHGGHPLHCSERRERLRVYNPAKGFGCVWRQQRLLGWKSLSIKDVAVRHLQTRSNYIKLVHFSRP